MGGEAIACMSEWSGVAEMLWKESLSSTRGRWGFGTKVN